MTGAWSREPAAGGGTYSPSPVPTGEQPGWVVKRWRLLGRTTALQHAGGRGQLSGAWACRRRGRPWRVGRAAPAARSSGAWALPGGVAADGGHRRHGHLGPHAAAATADAVGPREPDGAHRAARSWPGARWPVATGQGGCAPLSATASHALATSMPIQTSRALIPAPPRVRSPARPALPDAGSRPRHPVGLGMGPPPHRPCS
jgi:hypothetical protein